MTKQIVNAKICEKRNGKDVIQIWYDIGIYFSCKVSSIRFLVTLINFLVVIVILKYEVCLCFFYI